MNTIEHIKKEIIYRRDEYLRCVRIVEASGGKDIVSECRADTCDKILDDINKIVFERDEKRSGIIVLMIGIAVLLFCICCGIFL
jgi:hypothetical protein